MISNSFALNASEQLRMDALKKVTSRGDSGIAELIEMLGDTSWVVRREVIEALSQSGNAAVDLLCYELVHNRTSETRIAATVDALVSIKSPSDNAVAALAVNDDPAIVADVAQILGRRRHAGSVSLLIKLIDHESDNVAVGAIEALGKIGGKAAIEALITSTTTGNFFRTFPAIDVLGRSGDPRAVEPLTKLLENPSYLPEAARALGRTGEKSAVKSLMKLLNSSSDTVVRVAAISLTDLRDRFEEKSGVDSKSIETMIRDQISVDVVRRLARMLPQLDTAESIAITKFLGTMGNAEAVPQLKIQLDADSELAESAAQALKQIGVTEDAHLRQAIIEGSSARRKFLLPLVTRSIAAEDITICLTDSDSEVKVLACETLSRLGVTTVVPELFKLLSDSNLRVVHAATAAIQALGSRQARELAVLASKSESPLTRRAALNILSYFGDSSATQPLLIGLKDSDNRVREAALQGLPYLEDLSAKEALYEFARDPNVRMKSLAMRAIGQLPKSSERAISVLLKGLKDEDPWVRYYACQSLGRLSYSNAAADVAQLLNDEAGQVRVAAVESLSNLDSPEAHNALRSAVESSDADVKRAALVGLGIARRKEDLPVILSEINSADAPTRLIALSALVSFSSPKVFGALSAAGSDPDELVRSAAIGFLASRPEHEATEILINFLGNESTRDHAKAALNIHSTGRVSGILISLEAANDDLATVLVSILGRLGSDDHFKGLLSAMELSNVAARKAAVTLMATHSDQPVLMNAIKDASENDPDREVRQICRLLLNE